MEKWNKTFIMPQYFHDLILKLSERIPNNKYQYVYGIPRGGLIIAVYLSHYSELGLVTNFPGPIETTLIVDDIVDTGKTMKEFVDIGFDTATIHYKPRSLVKPTYFVEKIKNEDWIVYPYEKPEEKPNREI